MPRTFVLRLFGSRNVDLRVLAALPLVALGCAREARLGRPTSEWVASPHFRPGPRTPADVDAIVIHTTEGRYDETLSFAENQARIYAGTIRYFQNNGREVSAHYLLGPNGEITRMVDERHIAHTQTYYNARSIGIECAGWSDRPETWTPAMLDSLVELVAWLAVEWDVPVTQPAGDAHDGPNAIQTGDGPRFNGAGIIGHYQIQPWNRTDPGPHFPWAGFLERVRRRGSQAAPRGR